MEKDMIHDFYHNTRAEIKELEAEINVATDDEPMDVEYLVVIEYYDPILKVDATQEKTVIINGN